MKFIKSINILPVTDIQRSLAYYTEKLGFEAQWAWDDPPTFGGVVREEVELFFSKAESPQNPVWFCIVVDNVDEYYESIKDKGGDIFELPDTKPWSMREMLVRDPDGHVVRVGHNTACD